MINVNVIFDVNAVLNHTKRTYSDPITNIGRITFGRAKSNTTMEAHLYDAILDDRWVNPSSNFKCERHTN